VPGLSSDIVRFGAFEVSLARAELRKQGLRIRLQEQPFQLLSALLEHPGEVVSREELIHRLWRDGTVVDYDRGLNAAVIRLRQALRFSRCPALHRNRCPAWLSVHRPGRESQWAVTAGGRSAICT